MPWRARAPAKIQQLEHITWASYSLLQQGYGRLGGRPMAPAVHEQLHSSKQRCGEVLACQLGATCKGHQGSPLRKAARLEVVRLHVRQLAGLRKLVALLNIREELGLLQLV